MTEKLLVFVKGVRLKDVMHTLLSELYDGVIYHEDRATMTGVREVSRHNDNILVIETDTGEKFKIVVEELKT